MPALSERKYSVFLPYSDPFDLCQGLQGISSSLPALAAPLAPSKGAGCFCIDGCIIYMDHMPASSPSAKKMAFSILGVIRPAESP